MASEEGIFSPSEAIKASGVIAKALKEGKKVLFWTPGGDSLVLKGDNHLLRLLQEHGQGKVEVETNSDSPKRVFKFTKMIVSKLYVPKK